MTKKWHPRPISGARAETGMVIDEVTDSGITVTINQTVYEISYAALALMQIRYFQAECDAIAADVLSTDFLVHVFTPESMEYDCKTGIRGRNGYATHIERLFNGKTSPENLAALEKEAQVIDWKPKEEAEITGNNVDQIEITP